MQVGGEVLVVRHAHHHGPVGFQPIEERSHRGVPVDVHTSFNDREKDRERFPDVVYYPRFLQKLQRVGQAGHGVVGCKHLEIDVE